MNINDNSKNKFNLSEMLEIASIEGKTAFITFVDDKNSPESKAASNYINSHHLLPKNYEDTTEAEIEERGKKLLDPQTTISEKKEILMLLAHLGVYESYQILKKYIQCPDTELQIWANMAFEECQTFVRQQFSEEALITFNAIKKTGRNEPCPCGSGKKFKKCCAKKIG